MNRSCVPSTPTRCFGRVAYAVGVALALYHIWMSTFGQLNTLWLTGVHFAGFGFLCALRYPLINLKSEAGAKSCSPSTW